MKRRLPYTPEELAEYQREQQRIKDELQQIDAMRLAELEENPAFAIKTEDGHSVDYSTGRLSLSASTSNALALSASTSSGLGLVNPSALMVSVDETPNYYFTEGYDLYYTDLPAVFPPPPTLIMPQANTSSGKKKKTQAPRTGHATTTSGGGTLIAPTYVPLPMFPFHKQEFTV
jgi:hypothetical protein